MIVVMKAGASQKQIDGILQQVEQLGLRGQVLAEVPRTIIAALDEHGNGAAMGLKTGDGVERIIPLAVPPPTGGADAPAERVRIEAGSLRLHAGQVAVIAGPCAVESRQQLLDVAQAVKEAGASALRGGAFKGRTSPYSFQGLKEKGLELLAEARALTGLAVVTEVLTPEQVPTASRYADVLQIGARSMQHYPLLHAAGESGRPVLLKRGPSATLEEWLLAAEYILQTGNPQVVLCERGIRTFETHTRFTLPLATVPALQEMTPLPVIVDPSHGTGKAHLVPAMARAAVAAGADGLMIEVHPDPVRALSDGYQALTPAAFAQMMRECRAVASALGRAL